MNKTGIEWCDYSWNPVTGCNPVSEGCEHCYAKAVAETRLRGRCGYDDKDPFAVKFHRDKLREPYALKKPSTIFICSMSDLFHEKLMLSDIAAVLRVVCDNPKHIFLSLTKRIWRLKNAEIYDAMRILNMNELPRNLWLGVTAENQKRADERIPILMQIPAKHRFVSVEPMLGPVDIDPRLDWVICGAETGPDARPMDTGYAIRLRNSCKDAGVPFFFKKVTKGNVLPDELKVREFPDFWEALK